MKFTRGHRVLATLVALLLVGTIGPWLIWGEAFERSFSLVGTLTWLRELGPWAAAAGVGLLVADIALPIPSTIVMSALGATYGFWVGGLLSILGSMLAGLTAYGLARWAGRPAAIWIAGEDSLVRTEELFARGGAWLVLTSRWLPILPEAVACLALPHLLLGSHGRQRPPWPDLRLGWHVDGGPRRPRAGPECRPPHRCLAPEPTLAALNYFSSRRRTPRYQTRFASS